ncbi:MAG: carbon-nitrogen hydrolase family protein [Desulfurococcales archaeon]|nr:carbon-nitrogen hydrolase family protein [Desulfurococcales archaeon]
MNVRLGLLHTRTKLGYRRANLKKLNRSLVNAVENKDVDAVVVPAFPLIGPIIGYYPEVKARHYIRSYAERLFSSKETHSVNILSKLAMSYGIEIIGGPIIERAGPRLYLTMFHIDSDGMLRGKYRKITVTEKEAEMGISPGREFAIFEIGKKLKVGVFSDEDLIRSEIFRYFQFSGVNVVIGTMLPYESDYIRITTLASSGTIKTMDENVVKSLLLTRALETGVPIILLGGAVEASNSTADVAFMPTIIAEPEMGVPDKLVKGYDDLEEIVVVEVDTTTSVPRKCDELCMASLKNFCQKGVLRNRRIQKT